MRRFIHSLLYVLLVAPGSALFATPLFNDDAVIDATLAGPLAALMGSKQVPDELPFRLHAGGSDFDIKVRLRGKSRSRVCEILPMRLNFKKNEVADTLFAGQDKIKLVVPCDHTERGEENVLKEYAAYRIFNLLTPASYRVRLLHITFSDTDSRSSSGNGRMFAFVIEPADQLAERLGGQVSGLPGVALSWLDPGQAAVMYVFQYLIANTDWSLVRPVNQQACCHNGTLIETDAKIQYVPYDFDLSGFVDAPYARPDPDLRLRSVTQRRYRGFCTDRVYLEAALDLVISERQPITEVIEALPLLSGKDKQKGISYLEKFFSRAEQRDKLLKSFERWCID
jgi:hypothetical protein